MFILTNLAGAYRKMQEVNKSTQLYERVLYCLDKQYMGNPDNIRMRLTVGNSLSIVYEIQGKHLEALNEISICIDLATKYDYGYALPTLLSAKAFNIIKLIEKKQLSEDNLLEAKKISQQAYFIATARGDERVIKSVEGFINKYINNQSPQEVSLPAQDPAVHPSHRDLLHIRHS